MPNQIQLKVNKVALGSSGTLITSGIHAEEYLEALKGEQAAEIYNKMRRSDPAIRKVIAAILGPIKAAKWFIEPGGDSPEDIRAAELMEQILFKDILWTKKLHEILTFIFHGHSVFEVVHQNKENKLLGKYTGLKQLGFRNQTTLTEWQHNRDTGKLEFIHQDQTGDVIVNEWLPADTLLIFYNEQEGDSNGLSILRPMFGPYKRKLLAYELMYIGMERFAIPTPTLGVPSKVKPDSAEYIAAVEALESFTSAENAYAVYPQGWDFELISKTFDPTKIQHVIQSENEEIAGSIIATFLQLGVGGNTGAFNLGERLEEFFRNGLEAIANVIKDEINEVLIYNLMKLNFENLPENLPKLQTSGISDEAGKGMMEVITGYLNAGAIIDDEKRTMEQHIRKIHNFPELIESKIVKGEQVEKKTENINTKVEEEVGLSNKRKDIKLAERTTKNPRTLINIRQQKILTTIEDSLEQSASKYIVDVIKKYKTLSDKQKLKATKDISITGINRLKKDLRREFTNTAILAFDMVGSEVPSKKGIKLSQKYEKIKKLSKDLPDGVGKSIILQDEEINPADFKRLPTRVQILIANEADILAEKLTNDIKDISALQFNTSESSTNDPDVLKMDMEESSDNFIASGTVKRAAVNSAALMVNETRNTFFFDDDVIDEIASFTFINPDPKSEICKVLANPPSTFAVNNTDHIRFNPPLHHNCKSYLRANLKTTKNLPEINEMPTITKKARESVTLGE